MRVVILPARVVPLATGFHTLQVLHVLGEDGHDPDVWIYGTVVRIA